MNDKFFSGRFDVFISSLRRGIDRLIDEEIEKLKIERADLGEFDFAASSQKGEIKAALWESYREQPCAKYDLFCNASILLDKIYSFLFIETINYWKISFPDDAKEGIDLIFKEGSRELKFCISKTEITCEQQDQDNKVYPTVYLGRFESAYADNLELLLKWLKGCV